MWALIDRRWAFLIRRTAKSTGQKQGPGHESESLKDRIRRHYHALRLILDGQKIWGLLALSVLAIRRFRCRYDAVISSSPPSAAHVVALASSKLFSCRLALDFRDPWIGNANYDPASTNWFREKVERALEARCCAAAGLIVTTTPGSRRLLIDRYSELGNRVHVVYNGYDKLCDTPADASDRKSLRMVFAGSLYLKRDPFFLMEAVKRLVENVDVDRHKVNLLFVGDCEFWNGRSLSEWVVANDMADVISIRSRVPKDELTTIIDQCNLLVNLAQGQPNQIPAKTFDYMGSGKEMLVVTEVESDTARLVNETMSGRILDPSSEHSASSVLEELYFAAVNGETLVRRRPDTARSFSRQSQNSHFLNLFESEID